MTESPQQSEYFHGQTQARLDQIEKTLEEIKKDVKSLLIWRGYIMGGAALISAGVTLLLQWLRRTG